MITLFIVGWSLVFSLQNRSYGLDTDLYTLAGAQVPPNLLIIFDNSSSMANEDQMPDYNPGCSNIPDCTIPPPIYSGTYSTDAVYKKSGNDWVLYKNQYSEILCAAAQSSLAIYGAPAFSRMRRTNSLFASA